MSTVVGPLCTRGHQSADEFQCEGVVEGDSAVGEGCADCGEGDVGGGVGGVDRVWVHFSRFHDFTISRFHD